MIDDLNLCKVAVFINMIIFSINIGITITPHLTIVWIEVKLMSLVVYNFSLNSYWETSCITEVVVFTPNLLKSSYCNTVLHLFFLHCRNLLITL